jgi:mgtE-like transporter
MPDLSFMVVVISLAGFALFPVLSFLSYYVSIASFRFGIDPDNVSIPVICSTADVIGVVVLLAVIALSGVL